jgi:hypothetical protein
MLHRNVVWLCACAALTLAAAPHAAAAAPEAAGETFGASLSAGGAWADGEGTSEYTPVSVSDDGRYVAFQSAASNLGEAGPAGVEEGFVKDLQTGAVALVTRADGIEGEAAAAPGISGLHLSGNARFVVFTSAATNLGTPLPEEEVGEQHVYRRDLQTGETTLVDRVSGAGGAILSRGAEGASISADGSVIAFTARVENLEDPSGDHAEAAVAVGYVRDLEAGTTVAVSRADGAEGAVGDEPAEWLTLSPDGRLAAFSSRATNLVPGVEEGVWEQVYLRDLEAETTTLVSQNALGEPGDRGSAVPTVFGPGACDVAFSSIAFNLLEPSLLAVSGEQVYVADRCASPTQVRLASQRPGEPFAPFAYTVAGGDSSGANAVFAAEFPGSSCCHVYLRDFAAEQTLQLDRASGAEGAAGDGEAEYFAIAANGCRAAFASRSTNLVPGSPQPGAGAEAPTEVYVRQLAPCTPTPPGEPGGGGPGVPPSLPQPAPTRLSLVRADDHHLTLRLSGPGRVSVRVRRLVELPRRRWRFLKTLLAGADHSGEVELALPEFGPGRYRLNLHLHGSPQPSIVRLLRVGEGRGGR